MGTNQKRKRRSIKQAIIVLIVLAGLIVVSLKFLQLHQEADLLKVHFVRADGSQSSLFKLELAVSPVQRKKGLMFRRELNSDGGMLFAFPVEEVHMLWMKETYIPLDMIFLSSDLKVVGVLHDVPILTTEQRKIESPSRYVIEVRAGTAKRERIESGARVVYEGRLPSGS